MNCTFILRRFTLSNFKFKTKNISTETEYGTISPIWHKMPWKPSRQLHVNEEAPFIQVPPFRHRLGLQKSSAPV